MEKKTGNISSVKNNLEPVDEIARANQNNLMTYLEKAALHFFNPLSQFYYNNFKKRTNQTFIYYNISFLHTNVPFASLPATKVQLNYKIFLIFLCHKKAEKFIF